MFKKLLVIFLLLATFFSRFVNLNWDRGFGFHPDENNLWGASRNIKFFSQTNPKFYAYGGFPIYLYSLFQPLAENKVAARAVSALCQILIVLLLYLIGKPLKSLTSPNSPNTLGIFAALLAIFSAGLIQAAHFLTVENLIGLFGLLEVYFLLTAYNNYKFYNRYILLAAISFGLGVSTKLSFVVFVLPFAVLLFPLKSLNSPKFPKFPIRLLKICFLFLISCFVFLLFNPSIFTNFNSFKSTLLYESAVATGQTPVFYTRQFIDTLPGLFQTLRVFPFIESWTFVPLFIIGIILIIENLLKIENWKTCPEPVEGLKIQAAILLFSILAACLSFFPFYVKWTRYVVQVLPVLIIPAALTLSTLWQKNRLGRLISLISLISLIPPFFLQLSVYLFPDTRLSAAAWAETNIPRGSKIFSEVYDLGILPFNPKFQNNITLFNFYELDDNKIGKKQSELDTLIHKSDYFISVSQRVYGNSLAHPDKFPASANFYRSLFDGSLGYQKVYESSSDGSDFFLQKKSLTRQNPALTTPRRVDVDHGSGKFSAGATSFSSPEETFSVFDNPTVMIFKKL